MSLHYPQQQQFQAYPTQYQPFPPQPMGYPSMPYPQTQMPFQMGPQLPPNVGSRTLWVGDMDEWMNEHWLLSTFSMGGAVQVTEVKVIRQRPSGQHAGYGFVEFGSQYEAQHVLNTFNNMHIPQHPSGKTFRLNWASHGLSGGKGGASAAPHGDHGSPEYALFVGDLAQDINDYQLVMAFRHYPSVRNAKVVVDTTTGMSKGYGFVKFGDEEEKDRAMREMNGTFISTRQVRCSQAQKKSEMVTNQKRNNPDMVSRGGGGGGGGSDHNSNHLGARLVRKERGGVPLTNGTTVDPEQLQPLSRSGGLSMVIPTSVFGSNFMSGELKDVEGGLAELRCDAFEVRPLSRAARGSVVFA
mmetsp:Transcript_20773/g.40365  ORF Transcript_20773/g.40365 Transcript_20773/m.40365 type:complete len:355 (+) Transcript_20773:333-1397(+)